ncbi:Putative F-box and FNIP repeat-containing protein L60 [Durusdinium trenchii]|uniref:F-box and FNIP repeat-containing protein L60 n=1 Tax=Durusdinium trenchii TaxID=1381693 RepID=A0ABP0N7S9_9DINO
MVLAAVKNKGDEVCELLDPPSGAAEGSRPMVGNLEVGSARDTVNVKNISKVWGQVQPSLLTNEKCEVSTRRDAEVFVGRGSTIQAGNCATCSLADASSVPASFDGATMMMKEERSDREKPDRMALLSVLCQDVTGAQRLLRQVERLMSLGAIPAKVNDLSRIIVAQSSMSCAGRALVLTSGGHVLDHSKPLLQQVTGEEVTFVARKVSAGEAAVSLQRALEGDASPIDGIVSLVFDDEFDQSLEGVTFPSSLQTLTFAYSFNESLKGVALPSSLLSLTFGSRFNQSLEGVTLPSSLQTLTFGDRFNKSLADVTLPSSLQSLTFGCVTFPSSLQTLSFSDSFNQSLKDVTLPSGLRTLTFGQDFNQSLEGVTFPNSLETLTFGHCFDQCLDGVTFSTSLHTLTFGDSFDQSLEGVTFPNSLETLTFGHCFDQSLEGVTWPVNLQTLTFGHCFDQSLDGVTLASSLQTLTFGYCFNKSLRGVMLPSSLQTLTFGYMFNRKLNAAALPDSLQTLTFGFLFNQSLEGVTLPSSLQTLSFGAYFNQSLEGVIWPSSLQTLTFGQNFDETLQGVILPSSLQTLSFGAYFNQSLEGVIWPSSLQTLTFAEKFNQSLEGVDLPSSLRSLTFGSGFDQSLEGVLLKVLEKEGQRSAPMETGDVRDEKAEKRNRITRNAFEDWRAQWHQKLQARLNEDMQMFSQILDSLAAGQTGHPNDAGAAVATARRQRSPVLLERSKEAEVVQITVDKDRVRGEGGLLRVPCSQVQVAHAGNNDEESKPNSEKATPRLKLSRIQSTMSAPARFVYLSPERKRHVLQRSEYLESSMTSLGSSYMQIHDFHPLPTWAREAKNERDPSATIRISGEAKLPSSFLDVKTDPGCKVRGDFADDVTGGAMVIQEQAAKGHLMIFPSSPRKMTWDVFGATLIVYDLFTISMQVFDPPETDFTKSMQWLILIYWTMNMLVSCMVGYIDKGIFVMVPIKVFLHYLKTWFIIDLVVAPRWSFSEDLSFDLGVGSDWAFSLSESTDNAGSSVKLLRSLRLFRMVRLIRILRLRKTMESYLVSIRVRLVETGDTGCVSDLVDSEYISIIVSIFKMLALLMIVNHVIACFWFWIGDSAGGWIEMHHLLDEQWEYQYATSLHWAITQFTPASMHIQPQNLHERLFALGVVVFALVGFSYVVGSISGSLAQLRGMTENRARQFWELRRHLRKNKVSITLNARIQKYVEHVLESQEENVPAEDIKLLTLLSEQLRSELECEICMPHFSVHPLFARLCVVSRHTIHRLANNAIQKKQLARTDSLFLPGETATHMYIVVYGRLIYSRIDSKGNEHKELVDKGEDWISEPVLWTDSWIHLGLLISMTESDLMVLDPLHFGRIVNLNPDAAALAHTYVMNFIKWINSVPRDSLSDIWQGENVGPRVAGFMELDENQFRSAKSLAAKLMNWQKKSHRRCADVHPPIELKIFLDIARIGEDGNCAEAVFVLLPPFAMANVATELQRGSVDDQTFTDCTALTTFASPPTDASVTDMCTPTVAIFGDWDGTRVFGDPLENPCVRLAAHDAWRSAPTVERRSAPAPDVTVAGATYKEGVEIFLSEDEASSQSRDGSVHTMSDDNGVIYFMPGPSHADRSLYAQPFDLDGYFPLYETEAAAQLASTEAGGTGSAFSVGPGSNYGAPGVWSQAPADRLLWMPSDAVSLYLGDYVAPFTLDGYFPLYHTAALAAKASADSASEALGPQGERGHPRSWSTGTRDVYYMPSLPGGTKFYGSYPSASPVISYAAVVDVAGLGGGASVDATSAGKSVEAERNFPHTAAAAALLSAAPASAWFAR